LKRNQALVRISVDPEFAEYIRDLSLELGRIMNKKISQAEATKIVNVINRLKGKPIIVVLKKNGRKQMRVDDVDISDYLSI